MPHQQVLTNVFSSTFHWASSRGPSGPKYRARFIEQSSQNSFQQPRLQREQPLMRHMLSIFIIIALLNHMRVLPFVMFVVDNV